MKLKKQSKQVKSPQKKQTQSQVKQRVDSGALAVQGLNYAIKHNLD